MRKSQGEEQKEKETLDKKAIMESLLGLMTSYVLQQLKLTAKRRSMGNQYKCDTCKLSGKDGHYINTETSNIVYY